MFGTLRVSRQRGIALGVADFIERQRIDNMKLMRSTD